MSLQIDEQQARRFLEALDPDEQTFVFQTFDDLKERKERTLSRVFVGPLSQVLPALNHLQAQGAGVFVQIQGGRGRGQEYVTYGRAVVVDADDPDDATNVIAQIKQEMPTPSALVQSSNGKFHAYWFTHQTSTEVTAQLTADAADIAGTDPSVKSPERVMRLPGTWHMKAPSTPQPVKLLSCSKDRRYSGDAVLRILAQCSRRGARMASGTGQFVQMYDEVFGLPIVQADDMDSLPSGNRTQKLISYCGRLVGEGWSAQWIEQELRRIAAERLPPGDTPISEKSWQNEILPAIARFQQKQSRESGQPIPQGPAPTPVAVNPNIPGMPQAQGAVPPPPPAATPTGLPAGLNDPKDEITDRPNVNLSMDEWVQRFVWIEEGQFVIDTTKPLVAGKYSAADFEKSHKNHRSGDTLMFNKWLANGWRRTMRDFTFAPGKGQVVTQDKALYYNTFEPPTPLLETFDPDRLRLFEDQMAFLFPDADAWWRMMNWIVFTVCRPETRIPWSPVLISGEGRGKTWLVEVIKAMYDGRYTASVETEELEKPYNSYMADTLLVCFEEVHTRNKHALLDRFKTMITNSTLEINNKFGKKGQRDIYANTLMTSNHDDALALEQNKDSRRYWIYAIKQPKLPDRTGAALYEWIDTTGPKHLMSWCETVDQSDWAFNAWPEYTEAKDVMIKANMSLVTRALVECMDDRVGVFQLDLGDERQIETSLAMWLDQDRLDKRQKQELKHLLRQHTSPLRRIRMGNKYTRVLVWRNEVQWAQSPDSIILKEYDRAKIAALGQDPGTALTPVKGGTK